MIAIFIVAWCLIGTAGLIWLCWDREAFTWGNLFWCTALGCVIGPFLWFIIAAKVLVEAEFWNKPIFGKSK